MKKPLIVIFAAIALTVLSGAQDLWPPKPSGRRNGTRLSRRQRKKAKIVIAIPPVNELRKEMDNVLKQKFGIEAELRGGAGTEKREPDRRGKKSRRELFRRDHLRHRHGVGPHP